MRRATPVNDIVVMGTHPFTTGVPLGDWHLARTLARRGRVLWVDPPASPLAPRRGAASATMFRRRPVPAGDGLLVASPIAHSGRLRPTHAGIVDALVATQVRRWMRLLGMGDVDLITFSPRFGTLAAIPRRTLTLWLKDRDWATEGAVCADWLAGGWRTWRGPPMPSWASPTRSCPTARRSGSKRHASRTAVTSRTTVEPRPEPAVLTGLGRPRVVFSGAWNRRVDAALVAAAAARLPHVTFVIVGAVAAPLPAAPNVHSLGAVPYAELPAHLQAADVGIVPYRRSDFNDASCPLKVYEYLAAGLPVVTTSVDTRGLPPDLVRPVNGVEGFVTAIGALAARDAAGACRSEAARHSWDARADALLATIDLAVGGDNLVVSGTAR